MFNVCNPRRRFEPGMPGSARFVAGPDLEEGDPPEVALFAREGAEQLAAARACHEAWRELARRGCHVDLATFLRVNVPRAVESPALFDGDSGDDGILDRSPRQYAKAVHRDAVAVFEAGGRGYSLARDLVAAQHERERAISPGIRLAEREGKRAGRATRRGRARLIRAATRGLIAW